MTDPAQAIAAWQARSQAQLSHILDQQKSQIAAQKLHAAMCYSVLGGGKRLRPCLVYAAGFALGIPEDALDAPAAAVELIHAYSLVHDDLPAMDDDDLRRGQPTCHRAYDEATAILVGDALQSLAFELLENIAQVRYLARAAGAAGMCGGQALDMAATNAETALALTALDQLHAQKTGALITASVLLPSLGGNPIHNIMNKQNDLKIFGENIGLAFQIQDDILDVLGDTATLGKQVGADSRLGKSTYPQLLGMEFAQERAQECVKNALMALDSWDEQAEGLRFLARQVISRKY